MQRVYSIKQFCKFYKIASSSFYLEIKQGRLRSFKSGYRTYITRGEAERWNRIRKLNRKARKSGQAFKTRKSFALVGYVKLFFRKRK